MDGILCPHLEYYVLSARLQYFTSKVMTFQIFFGYAKDFLENLKTYFPIEMCLNYFLKIFKKF